MSTTMVSVSDKLEARRATVADIDVLMALERSKWTEEQSTSAEEMRARILAYPELSLAVFCPTTGEALASCFLKPISLEALRRAETWADCAAVEPRPPKTRALFGISLSSISPAAVDAIGIYLWSQCLRGRWREIYLGSPVPGLRAWRLKNPDVPIAEYVFAKRRGLPLDPQLRYYFGKGYRRIIAWKAGYFPHAASLDHGVIIRAATPLAWAWPLWSVVPTGWIRRLGSLYFSLRARVE